MNWIRVIDELPVIAKNKNCCRVIIAEFDPCYDEINPGHGYSIHECLYSSTMGFITMDDRCDWIPPADIVTHWMYTPKAPEYDPEVLNPIFKHYHETALPQSPLKII